MSTMTKVVIGVVALAAGVIVYVLFVGPGPASGRIALPGPELANDKETTAFVILHDDQKGGATRCIARLPGFVKVEKKHDNVKWLLVNLCAQDVETLIVRNFRAVAAGGDTLCPDSSSEMPFDKDRGEGKPYKAKMPGKPGEIELKPKAKNGGCWTYELYAKDASSPDEYPVADPIIRIDPR